MEDVVDRLFRYAVSYGLGVLFLLGIGFWFFRMMKRDIEEIDRDKKSANDTQTTEER